MQDASKVTHFHQSPTPKTSNNRQIIINNMMTELPVFVFRFLEVSALQ